MSSSFDRPVHPTTCPTHPHEKLNTCLVIPLEKTPGQQHCRRHPPRRYRCRHRRFRTAAAAAARSPVQTPWPRRRIASHLLRPHCPRVAAPANCFHGRQFWGGRQRGRQHGLRRCRRRCCRLRRYGSLLPPRIERMPLRQRRGGLEASCGALSRRGAPSEDRAPPSPPWPNGTHCALRRPTGSNGERWRALVFLVFWWIIC